jgi:hypothetical protein
VSGSGASAERRIPITGADPISAVQVLGWAKGGIVLQVPSRDRKLGHVSISLRLYSPDGNGFRIVSQRAETNTFLAIAADVPGWPGSASSAWGVLLLVGRRFRRGRRRWGRINPG